jgi:BON domain-containing protein
MRRAAPLLAAGAAVGWYLRRRGLLAAPQPALPQTAPPAEPPPERAEPEPQPEAEIAPHAEAVAAVSDAQDVGAVVEDLLTSVPEEEEDVMEAEVVPAPQASEELAAAVRAALSEQEGLPEGSVEVEVSGGTVWLRGELERPEAITEAERRAAAVAGVHDVRNLLHLPGTPPPRTGELR